LKIGLLDYNIIEYQTKWQRQLKSDFLIILERKKEKTKEKKRFYFQG
jgi:AAA15 family ATPase/GTPase